jgi:hypothetical protein
MIINGGRWEGYRPRLDVGSHRTRQECVAAIMQAELDRKAITVPRKHGWHYMPDGARIWVEYEGSTD